MFSKKRVASSSAEPAVPQPTVPLAPSFFLPQQLYLSGLQTSQAFSVSSPQQESAEFDNEAEARKKQRLG